MRAAHRPRPTRCPGGPGPQPVARTTAATKWRPRTTSPRCTPPAPTGSRSSAPTTRIRPRRPSPRTTDRDRGVRRLRLRHRLAGAVAAPAGVGAGRRELHRTAARPYAERGRILPSGPGRPDAATAGHALLGSPRSCCAARSPLRRRPGRRPPRTPSSRRCAARSSARFEVMPLREGDRPGRPRPRAAGSRSSTAWCSMPARPLSGAELRDAPRRRCRPRPAPQLSRQRRPAQRCSRRRPPRHRRQRRRRQPRRRRPPHPRRRPRRARRSPRHHRAPPQAPAAPTRTYRRTGVRLAFGKSVTVAEDEEVTDGVVALGGHIRIAGRVRDEVVAIGGDVELLPTADVRGDITAIGGAGPDRAGRPARRRRSITSPSMPGAGWAGRRWGGRGSTSAARRGGSRSPAR